MSPSKTPIPLDDVLPDLIHPDYAVRRDAVRRLGQSRNGEAVVPLIQALSDKTVAVKRQAIRGLGKLKDPRAIPALIMLLDDPVCNVHRPAYEELIRFGEAAVPHLIQALQAPQTRIRMTAAMCLGEIGHPDAVFPLLQSIHDPVDVVQMAAARALQPLRDERTREPLAALLEEDDSEIPPNVKTNIAIALAYLGDARAVPFLEAAYDRQPGGVVVLTAALGSIQDVQAIAVLEKIRGSSSELIRACAEHALQRLGYLPSSPDTSSE